MCQGGARDQAGKGPKDFRRCKKTCHNKKTCNANSDDAWDGGTMVSVTVSDVLSEGRVDGGIGDETTVDGMSGLKVS
ncbi:hypothetical protein QVD17_39687 [Tagetes erecta]|uniref:Uncharacterized protein n=1 Tax=Tagetes erecta TaxID=13708 RepID=A0AAD8JSW3_TARER|nr:hypothetical protein QVD17_39687 [Tagetes erecta]